jgi:hypothetical protein
VLGEEVLERGDGGEEVFGLGLGQRHAGDGASGCEYGDEHAE